MEQAFEVLSKMMHQADPDLSFAFELWNGRIFSYGNNPVFTLRVKTQKAGIRLFRDQFLGFGESYMKGDIEVKGNIDELLRLGFAIRFDDNKLSFLQKIRLAKACLLTKCTKKRSVKNIEYHYDLGNDFYSLYLDPTLTYSCAYFKNGTENLEKAQKDKYQHISKKLMLKPKEKLLDIGCGWGGMLIHAAQKFGVKGIGITLSKNQYTYAREKVKNLGLEKQIRILFKDYREVKGEFDKIVSIGMYEHVGKEYQRHFVKSVSKMLKPKGLGLLHTIGKDIPTPTDPWTLRYIFPGGYLPSLDEITKCMGKDGLVIWDIENLRLHYAHTLELWAKNFEKNWDKIVAMKDESFARRWRLFLRGSAAGFRFGDIRVFQVLFSKGLNNELPLTRNHQYL